MAIVQITSESTTRYFYLCEGCKSNNWLTTNPVQTLFKFESYFKI